MLNRKARSKVNIALDASFIKVKHNYKLIAVSKIEIVVIHRKNGDWK